MRQKKERPRIHPRAIFSVGTQEQFQQAAAKPAVHIDCEGGLCFENSRSIVEYTDSVIQLDMGKMGIRVEGDSLRMTFYRKDRVSVRGRITSIEFLYGGGNG